MDAAGRQHWNAGRSLALYCCVGTGTQAPVATSWDLFTSVATGHYSL